MSERVNFRFPTAIHFGSGARDSLAEFARDHQVERPLVVTDKAMVSTEAYRLVKQTCDKTWPNGWTVFDGVHPNPLAADADDALKAYRAGRCDGVIALGGGSAIDGAKALLLRIAEPGCPLQETDLAALPEKIVPLCAIPTTAGTGSEVGRSTVVTVPALGRKIVLGAPALLPTLAILDPVLTVGLPAHLTAATGMDAMTHAIESFVCPMFHPMCDGIALEAIYRIAQYLPRAVKNGEDLQARGEMLVAAAMGAVAFQKDLGAAHSMAHPLSSEFDVHHGLANAIVLPAVIRFNGEKDSQQYDRVAKALGIFDATDPANAVADYIDGLNEQLELTRRLRDLNIPQSAIDTLASKAFDDGCHLTNPRKCQRDDFVRLYRECW
ncbi:MAG: iron-containing alcohol dehydrogenase [Deltaproteobacteria bacterium]|nr:iron-containing alcohol dehydrogenase [Deltaproteobacteria bacterium]